MTFPICLTSDRRHGSGCDGWDRSGKVEKESSDFKLPDSAEKHGSHGSGTREKMLRSMDE